MKTLQKILCCLLLSIFVCGLTACEKDNLLDATVYLKDTVNYELNEKKKTEGTFELSNIINQNSELKNYKRIQITTKKDWTYGLEIEKIEFDILLSMPVDVDLEITVSNLENGENFNESQNTYYYHKTLSINKECTNVKLDINDIFNKKDAVISLEINESCYTSTPELKIGIGNFKMYGQHTPANY